MGQTDRLRVFIRWLVIVLLMTITANGWRVVFKVSKGGDVSPGSSMFKLWNGSDIVYPDPAGFVNTNQTYMAPYQPTYKSEIINMWEQSDIEYVKVGVYDSGVEKFVMVFDAVNTTKTTWFDNTRILRSTSGDLGSSSQHPFSLEGSYLLGRFLALQTTTTSCLNAKGWLMVVDKDMTSYCGNKTSDTPYFIYTPAGNSHLFTNGAVADAFAVFVGKLHSKDINLARKVKKYGVNVPKTISQFIGDDCVVNPCQHGGTCSVSIDGYSCTCSDQVYGHSCQYDCPCLYKGKCHPVSAGDIQSDGKVVINGEFINDQAITFDDDTRIACKCPEYRIGANCNTSTLQCASSPCLNYGKCIEGYTSFTCKCNEDYTGDICQDVRPPPKEKGLNTGAKAAIGLCIPLLVIVGIVVAYIVYMFKNPDARGHEATVKQYTIAREFVRKSMRRLSGRRGRPSDGTKDTTAISPKEKEVNEGQINLAFDDGGKASYGRQNSEYYNMSADDNAVISGPNVKYPVREQYAQEQGREMSRHYQNIPSPQSNENAFYKEYQPTQLHGGGADDHYSPPGYKYDEYNRNDYANTENPVPQPRTQRQTGRRGRQNNTPDESNQNQNQHNKKVPYGNNQENEYTPHNVQGTPNKKVDHDRQIRSMTPRGNNDMYDTDQSTVRTPRSEHFNSQQHNRMTDDPRRNEAISLSPRYLQQENIPERSMHDSRYSPGYQQPNKTDRYADVPSRSPGYRQDPAFSNRSKEGSGLSPGYRQPQRDPTRPHGGDKYSATPTHGYNGRSPRSPGNFNRPNDRYNDVEEPPSYDRYLSDSQQSGRRSDEHIVFTSSEPMDDVTV